MAKKDENRNAKSKMTVMVFQLEGNDETLQDGIRTMSQAISGMINPIRAIPIKTGNGTDAEAKNIEGTDAETNGDHHDEEPETTASGGYSGPRKTPKAPKMLDGLTVNVEELRNLCEAKKVGEMDTKKYLVISHFLKEKHNINAVSADHIHTCYRLMNWNTPRDAGATLRGLKKSGHYKKGDATGEYVLIHVGENAVRDMGT